MIVLIGMLLGTLAVIGVIRAIVLFLIKKIDNKQHWVAANFITALLRTIVALFQLWGAPYILINLLVVFAIYLLEQVVWFVYDFIQSKRDFKPASWGLIISTIIGGTLWLFALRIVTMAASSAIIAS
ncbi:MAG: hypothetical protein E7018_01210 [Alphaproteobacteria bacterium]|nr:hypothetical protein [Alphaproteobacteria bacterium]